MEKFIYQAPEMEVVKVNLDSSILVISGGGYDKEDIEVDE